MVLNDVGKIMDGKMMNQDLAVQKYGVSSPCKFRRIEEEKFHAIDYEVMGIAFSIQNELGLGNQLTHLISDSTAFKITSIHCNQDVYRRELQQFLRRTNLRRIEWLNLDHHDIHFETILH